MRRFIYITVFAAFSLFHIAGSQAQIRLNTTTTTTNTKTINSILYQVFSPTGSTSSPYQQEPQMLQGQEPQMRSGSIYYQEPQMLKLNPYMQEPQM